MANVAVRGRRIYTKYSFQGKQNLFIEASSATAIYSQSLSTALLNFLFLLNSVTKVKVNDTIKRTSEIFPIIMKITSINDAPTQETQVRIDERKHNDIEK